MFKDLFCEKFGVTLSKIFDDHIFHRNRVECVIKNTLEISFTFQFVTPINKTKDPNVGREPQFFLYVTNLKFLPFEKELSHMKYSQYAITGAHIALMINQINICLTEIYPEEDNIWES